MSLFVSANQVLLFSYSPTYQPNQPPTLSQPPPIHKTPPQQCQPHQSECLCEATLEVLVDEADDLITQEAELREITGDAPAEAAGDAASDATSDDAGDNASSVTVSEFEAAAPAMSPSASSSPGLGFSLASHFEEDAARRTKSVCHALRAHEQDLFLAFAAVLRLARASGAAAAEAVAAAAGALAASWRKTGDAAAQHTVIHIQGSGRGSLQNAASSPALLPAFRTAQAGHNQHSKQQPGHQQQPRKQAPMGHDAIVRALCDAVAGWLVHPLGEVCPPAQEAVATFLWYLVTEARGYRWVVRGDTGLGDGRVWLVG